MSLKIWPWECPSQLPRNLRQPTRKKESVIGIFLVFLWYNLSGIKNEDTKTSWAQKLHLENQLNLSKFELFNIMLMLILMKLLLLTKT